MWAKARCRSLLILEFLINHNDKSILTSSLIKTEGPHNVTGNERRGALLSERQRFKSELVAAVILWGKGAEQKSFLLNSTPLVLELNRVIDSVFVFFPEQQPAPRQQTAPVSTPARDKVRKTLEKENTAFGFMATTIIFHSVLYAKHVSEPKHSIKFILFFPP